MRNNPYEPTVYGVGYLGEGKYHVARDSEYLRSYYTWTDILRRCYDKSFQVKNPSYVGCEIYEDWKNYQVFAEWYYENYYEVGEYRMHIDKDILKKNNKIYCPQSCVFVPLPINIQFVKRNKRSSRNEMLPMGIRRNGKYGYQAKVRSWFYGDIVMPTTDSLNTAFLDYKRAKEILIKEIADYFKDDIPIKLYDAMYSYEVEITD